jgi:hypothetical protein
VIDYKIFKKDYVRDVSYLPDKRFNTHSGPDISYSKIISGINRNVQFEIERYQQNCELCVEHVESHFENCL